LRGAIAFDVDKGSGRAFARPDPPIYVLAAKAAIHGNRPQTQCKRQQNTSGTFDFFLKHHKVDACRGWPPARPGRNSGILNLAKARSRIPACPEPAPKCDSPAPLRGEEAKNGDRVPAAIPFAIALHGTQHTQLSQTVSLPPPLSAKRVFDTTRGTAGVGGDFRHGGTNT
jgi:hypothetical protein